MEGWMDRGRRWVVGSKATATMVVLQAVSAGVSIFYKLATNDGMDPRILLTYRFLFATTFIFPFAFILERKKRPKLTWTVIGQSFLCGLLGGSLSQNLALEGLVLTSVTFSSAISNLIPAVTYTLAVCFGLEKLSLRATSGKAKLAGTFVGIGGAMLLTFYKGSEIHLWSTDINLLSHSHHAQSAAHQTGSTNQVLGGFLCLISTLAFAGWYVVQAKMSNNYPCFYSSATLMTFMALLQSFVAALFVNRNWDDWKLGWNIRLLSVSYAGISFGVVAALTTWCVHLKGPLFVSVFGPLNLIIAAVTSFLILDEKLHLGSVIGAVGIVAGLYLVLWGKMKETKAMTQLTPSAAEDDRELSTISVGTEGEESKAKATGTA